MQNDDLQHIQRAIALVIFISPLTHANVSYTRGQMCMSDKQDYRGFSAGQVFPGQSPRGRIIRDISRRQRRFSTYTCHLLSVYVHGIPRARGFVSAAISRRQEGCKPAPRNNRVCNVPRLTVQFVSPTSLKYPSQAAARVIIDHSLGERIGRNSLRIWFQLLFLHSLRGCSRVVKELHH